MKAKSGGRQRDHLSREPAAENRVLRAMDASTRPSRRATGSTTTIGWLLDEGERTALLKRFPPAYPDVVAHHVTLKMGARAREPLPAPAQGAIVGEADDGDGVQCLVVEVEGSTLRPDGGTFHITWSLCPVRRRRAVESNGVIAWLGWKPVEPVKISLTPGRF